MKKTALICALLVSIPTFSMAYSSVDSPFYENAIWKKRKLTKPEMLEALKFLKASFGEALKQMGEIPAWNGTGSNQEFDRHIELKERYTCQFQLSIYELLVFMKIQMGDYPQLKADYQELQVLFDEMVSGKKPNNYTIEECERSDNWFPM